LNAIRRFIGVIPKWAFALVLLVIVVNVIYLVNMYQVRFVDIEYKFEKGKCIISEMSAWGPTQRAGLKTGDIVLSIDSIPVSGPEQLYSYLNQRAIGDTLTYKILRNNNIYNATRITSSYMKEAPALYYIKYFLMILFSCASMYVLYKKPGDRTAVLFFIYSQSYAVFHIAWTLPFANFFSNFATAIFWYSVFLSGPVLIHFTLLFPQPSQVYRRFRQLPVLFYGTGFLIASLFIIYHMLAIYYPSNELNATLSDINRINVLWILFTFCVSMAIAAYQFRSIKNTFARNHIRMGIIGAFF